MSKTVRKTPYSKAELEALLKSVEGKDLNPEKTKKAKEVWQAVKDLEDK